MKWIILLLTACAVGCQLQNADAEIDGPDRDWSNYLTMKFDSTRWDESTDYKEYEEDTLITVLFPGDSIVVEARTDIYKGHKNNYEHAVSVNSSYKRLPISTSGYTYEYDDFDEYGKIDSLFFIDTIVEGYSTVLSQTVTLRPKELCAGIYKISVYTRVHSIKYGVETYGASIIKQIYIDGETHCDTTDQKAVEYFDVTFASGAFESLFDIDSNANYPYWQVVESKSGELDMMITSFDSTIMISSLDFLKQYAGKEGTNLSASVENVYLQDSLNYSKTEFYDVLGVDRAITQKGDISRFMILNNFFEKVSDAQHVPAKNHITIESVGQQFVTQTDKGLYLVEVLDVMRDSVGHETVSLRFAQ
ncbi:MAG: hypothetical protein OCC49_10775 [Fibrobacterales bacterium]